MIEFLQQLKDMDIKTANITDLTAQIQFRKMVYFNLDEYFDYVVTSEESGQDKPSRQPFDIALDKLQIPAKKIWMIGDDCENDVAGAQKSGMISIQISHSNNQASIGKCQPDFIFSDYNELSKLLTEQEKRT